MNWCPDKYTKTWNFATVAHDGQTYGSSEKGNRVAYLNHIGNVSAEVMWGLQAENSYDENLAVQCAILHDVIEDTKYTYENIVSQFGEKVANGVLALTKNEQLGTKQEQMQDSLNRILRQPQEVWMVKLADRICNLQSIPHYWTPKKIQYYKEEAILIHDTLKKGNPLLAERLVEKIQKYNTCDI